MRVDKTKAELVFARLLDAYFHKEYPFNLPEAIPPQVPENLPKSFRIGTREHALFLFKVCYWMRGGIKSNTAIKQLAKLYHADPKIFLPESESMIVEEELIQKLKDVGLGFNADEIASAWKKNLRTIGEKWQGDPRSLFADIVTYEEACERIQNRRGNGFHGFQEKMVSMLTYFYMDAGIVDPWHFPVPVDFHVLRTVFAHEIVIPESGDSGINGFYSKPILATVRELFYNYCVLHNVDPLRLCDAVWLYSGLMCNQHPGNQSSVGERNGRKTMIAPVKRWTTAQTAVFERTCRMCPVRATCRWCVPSALYYIGGRIERREVRDEPPQLSLF
ncbi:MAG: hypothetical protein HGA67_02325 [Candidatus Yonathbacteria bacterium]|nr:hypothetical protein [Candidatus Yonathbacteria bacterium]